MSSIGSPQASTCANDAVLREGHQSINSHLARRLWNLSFYAKKKRPKVMEHQLLLTFISSKSTRSSGEVIIRPKIFHNNFLRKKQKTKKNTNSPPPQIHGRPWNPPARRLVQGLGVGQESSEVETGRTSTCLPQHTQHTARNKALWSRLMKTHWGNP